MRGWSDTRLLVTTAKGVPEAQNRRVEMKVALAGRKCELAADRARSKWIEDNCFNSLTWQYSMEECKSTLKEIGRREPW